MDINDLRGLSTLFLMISFIGLLANIVSLGVLKPTINMDVDIVRSVDMDVILTRTLDFDVEIPS